MTGASVQRAGPPASRCPQRSGLFFPLQRLRAAGCSSPRYARMPTCSPRSSLNVFKGIFCARAAVPTSCCPRKPQADRTAGASCRPSCDHCSQAAYAASERLSSSAILDQPNGISSLERMRSSTCQMDAGVAASPPHCLNNAVRKSAMRRLCRPLHFLRAPRGLRRLWPRRAPRRAM